MANSKRMAKAMTNAMAKRWQSDGIGRVIGIGILKTCGYVCMHRHLAIASHGDECNGGASR